MKKTWKDYFFVGLQLGLILIYFIPYKLEVSWKAPNSDLLSGFVLFIGLALVVLAFIQLKTNLTPWPTPKNNSYLVTNGIFGLIRHPIYSGIFLILSGRALQNESPYQLSIAGLLIILFFFKSKYEEKQLAKKFKHYENYKKRTGAFMPKLAKPMK